MKIFCVGRNYVDHAKELNNPVPEEPVIFMKPKTAVLDAGQPFYYPEFSKNIYYEAEVVLKIAQNGRHIQSKFAHKYFEEITLGMDLTARDIQNKCKEKGLPWEKAKAFDHSAVVGVFISKDKVQPISNLEFNLNKNGVSVQNGNTANMIFNFDYLIAHISKYFTLNKGDMLFTGTPAGVGPVEIGDLYEGNLSGQPVLTCTIR